MRQEPVVVADPHAPVAPSKTVKISALKTRKARSAELELREGAKMPSGFDDVRECRFPHQMLVAASARLECHLFVDSVVVPSSSPLNLNSNCWSIKSFKSFFCQSHLGRP